IFCLCLFFMCSLKFKPLDAKFESWLPKDKGGAPSTNVNQIIDEIRVIMSWNTAQNKLERLFGQQVCPPDEAGNAKLLKLIKDSYSDYKARGTPNVPLIRDVGPRVPWNFVVGVFALGKDAGVQKLEFGTGPALDK